MEEQVVSSKTREQILERERAAAEPQALKAGQQREALQTTPCLLARRADCGGFEYQSFWNLRGERLRIHLRCDGSYAFQSSYGCDILTTGQGWSRLVTLPTHIAASQGYYSGSTAMRLAERAALQDEAMLLTLAEGILQ